MDAIGQIPAILIHGRADVSGPVRIAREAHRRWPASWLRIIEGEENGGNAMVDEWGRALGNMADEIQRRPL